MPIRPEMKALYPPDWQTIRARILARAEHRCEVCGVPNRARIVRRKDDPEVWEIEADLILAEGYEPEWDDYRDPIEVVLTISHQNHDPSDCRDSNLKALCQLHRLRYDAKQHAQTARRTRERRGGQLALMEATGHPKEEASDETSSTARRDAGSEPGTVALVTHRR